jgi:hypothetical protein
MLRDKEPKTPQEQKIADAEEVLSDAMNHYTTALSESWKVDGKTQEDATLFASRQVVLSAADHAATIFLSIARLSGEKLDVEDTKPYLMKIMQLVFEQVLGKVEEGIPDLIEAILAADN